MGRESITVHGSLRLGDEERDLWGFGGAGEKAEGFVCGFGRQSE